MPLNFEPIRLEQQADYRERLARCERIASDYSFINLWGWGGHYGLQWAWQDGLVWIRQEKPRKALWAPVGDWTAVDWPAALKSAKSVADRMIRVPEALLHRITQALRGDIQFEDSRKHWDYLYSVQELVDLKGNRFHKKKNLLNQFTRKTDHTYMEFGSSMVDLALGMQEDWCTWRDCEGDDTLTAENEAITRVLNDWRKLEGITGGALQVDHMMVAYTIAETMPDGTLIIHFEKACPRHKGSYQAINQIFLSQAPEGYTIVNREQDLDDEGIRKAKLSYNPVNFIKKYQIVL
ncbi:MAG: DUF2156 domain-containing protein [Desulfobacteraceae bacterium]|nr:MAG: DUF2156 domain-containing protein [Desulfobacteraceae bacterium]